MATPSTCGAFLITTSCVTRENATLRLPFPSMNSIHPNQPLIDDPYFKVTVRAQTNCPNRLIYDAMHQDYSEDFVGDLLADSEGYPSEHQAGKIAVKRLLAGGRGHYGCCENPQITFAVGYYPHSVMQQARTHRVGVSFDVQSGRYCGERVIQMVKHYKNSDIELFDHPHTSPFWNRFKEVFYVRPTGNYLNRRGDKYYFSAAQWRFMARSLWDSATMYTRLRNQGVVEEHARGVLPYDLRQHFVVSFNMRSLMHFLDLRHKPDAQLEIRDMAARLLPHFLEWSPEIAEWYIHTRLGKGKLAP